MFLGEENILAFWALDSRSLHDALQRTIVSAFRKQPILMCFSVVLQALILVMPWITFACALYWFILSSYNSYMQSIDMAILILLFLNLAVPGMIFTSSFALSKLSLNYDTHSMLYVVASPLSCFLFSVRLSHRSSMQQ